MFRHEDASLYCVWLLGSLPWPSTPAKKEVRGANLHAVLIVLFELLVSLADKWKGTLSLQDGQRGFNIFPGNSHEGMNVITINPNAV